MFKMMFKKFGSHCLIDYKSYFSYPWKIEIGNNVAINRGCSLYSSFLIKNAFIIIKDNVSFGPECVLFSAGQNAHDASLSDIGGSIIIEEGAYIGGRSIVRYGVTIGKGAVVGAGSVVTKDVAPFTIVGGTPARQIGIRSITD
jgi:maltose O-acetyltransferase